MKSVITQKAPSDLQEHIAQLTERGLVTRIDRRIAPPPTDPSLTIPSGRLRSCGRDRSPDRIR